jgi:sarcosine oxidase
VATRGTGEVMRNAPRVAVVGAGVVGLAAADALVGLGAEVRCFEKAVPGHAESIGLTRIFRHAHGDPALVRLALRAGEGWRAWENRFGHRLLGAEGLLITGDALAPAWERALRVAGASCQALDPAAFTERLPIGQPPPAAVLWDPAAGAIRARRTIDLLRQSVAGHIVPAEVLDLASQGTGVQVHTTEGTWACDEALITAGIDTPGLAARVGVHVPAKLIRHARLTFAPRRPQGNGALACWIDQSGAYGADLSAYAVPVGTTGRYAVGVSADGHDFPGSLDVEEVSRRSAALARRYVPAALPGLDPLPVDEVRCAYNTVGLPEGDGFRIERRGAVTVLYGNNLFKFAPVLGALLSQAVLHGAVPSDLSGPAGP